jgi:hypothetical protein
MSDIASIDDLKDQYIDKLKTKELREYANNQNKIIEKLSEENKKLKEQLESKKLVVATPISTEESICIEQIEILRSKSLGRELSLDEVKRLDLLVKNLRLAREQSTEVISSADYSDIKEAELVAIARGSAEEGHS